MYYPICFDSTVPLVPYHTLICISVLYYTLLCTTWLCSAVVDSGRLASFRSALVCSILFSSALYSPVLVHTINKRNNTIVNVQEYHCGLTRNEMERDYNKPEMKGKGKKKKVNICGGEN